MQWTPIQDSLRPVNPLGSTFRLLKGLLVVLSSLFLLPMQTMPALEEQLVRANVSATKT